MRLEHANERHIHGAEGGFVTTMSVKIRPVMVIDGPEAFTRRSLIESIREIYIGESRYGVVRIEPGGAVAGLLDECRTTGMFEAKKLVVVDPADWLFKSGGGEEGDGETGGGGGVRELILAYAQNPHPATVLVLTFDSWPKTTRLHKFLEADGAILAAPSPRPVDVGPWLVRRAWEYYKKKIDGAAVGRLADLVGPDYARLDSELSKLALYAADKPAITAAMVDEMVGFQHEQKVWDFIDALAESDAPGALTRHTELLQMDARAAFTIVGAVYHWLGRVAAARELVDRRLPDAQIIRELKLFPPSRANQTLSLARRWGLSGVQRAMGELLAVDMAAKTSLGDPQRTMETFIVRLSAIATVATKKTAVRRV